VRYRAIKGKRHYVYDHISEFYSEYPNRTPIKDWRDGEQGDWVWSDDESIVQLLKVSDIKHPNDRKNYKYSKGWCRTIVGTFLMNNKTFMDTDFDSHKNRYTFSKTIGNKSNLRKRKHPTKKERIFTTSIVAGHGPVKAYMDAYNEYSEDTAKKRALVLLKQERIVKEIEKSVLDIAKENGLDHEYVLRKLKHLADYSDDDNIMLQSVKEIGKIIGTSGMTIKQREVGVVGMFQGFSPEQLESAERRMINGDISSSETSYTSEEE
tara:strand:- start:681 stop:1475 length:795 start_codon:yes stop_codon:yes gene_type:complete